MTEPSTTRSAGGPGFYVKWIALPLIATIVAVGIVLARELSLRSQRGDLEKEAARGRTFLCTKLHGETAARTIMLPGEIHRFYETPIYAKISGYVKQMFVDKGSLVKAGRLVDDHRIARDRPASPKRESDLRPREDHGRSSTDSRVAGSHSAADCR
jgi:hypothetical protein